MRASSTFLAVALAWATFAAARASAGPGTIPEDSDLGRLQGRWIARAGARRELRVILDVRGQTIDAAITTPGGMRLKFKGEVKLDDTTSPRSVDWIKLAGADQLEVPPISGIYKFERDTFTVCNGGLNGSRPSEFKAGDGVLSEVVVFQREPRAVHRQGQNPHRASSMTPDAPLRGPTTMPRASRADSVIHG